MPKSPGKKRPRQAHKKPSLPRTSNGDLRVLIEALRSDVQQVAEGQGLLADRIENDRLELRAEMKEQYTLLSGAIAAVSAKTDGVRTELSEKIETIRIELSEKILQTREELHEEIQTVRTELQTTREELRGEIRALGDEVRTHTHSL